MHSVRLTPLETELLALVPQDGSRIDSIALAAKYYGEQEPDNARTIVVGRMRTIARKLERMKAERRVNKSKRRGPHPAEFWITQASA